MRLGPQNRICPVSGRSGPRNLLLLSVQTGVLHDLLENVDLPTFLHRHDHVVRLIYHLRVQLLAGGQTPAQEPVPGALQAAVLLQRCGGDAPGGDGQVNPGGLVECQSRAAGETVPPVLAVPPATLAGPAVRRGVLDFRATDPGVIRGMPGPYKGSERAFDALRGPGQHLERLLDAALACEASGLDPVQVLDRAMGAAALAEAELLVQAEDSLQETAEER